jgi:hypothetical protein|tara:strand:+ start:314 stop:535 length:222 start_codon:yes stop_codon:yes gene_type:complete
MQVRGIRSSRLINRATCGGDKKAGLVPRHGFMMSGVESGVVLSRESAVDNGKMPMSCVASTTRVKLSPPFSMM